MTFKDKYQSAQLADDWRRIGFGIYLHWPFCSAKCPYCDFNSHVAGALDHEAWTAAYLREIDRLAALVPGRVVSTIYFGGGTPSLMAPATIEAVLRRIADRWPMANDPEITLEANPTSVEASRLAAFRAAGINRVSLGVQALDDGALRQLGRNHDAATALAALEIARKTFPRVSFDLIYARQDQTLSQWEAELGRALALEPAHLSLYQLTIEPGTIFGRRHAAGRLPGLPDEDLAAEMFAMTREMTESAGLAAYEVSNHARPGEESRHNLLYWRYGDWAGIGPGAHGRLTVDGTRRATHQHAAPQTWLAGISNGEADAELRRLSWPEAAEEMLMMGLRLSEGIDLQRYRQMSGKALPARAVADLVAIGLLEQRGDRLVATREGVPVLNAIIARLIDD